MKPYETINGYWKTVQAVFRCYKAGRYMDVTESISIRLTEHDYTREINDTKKFLEKKYDQVVFRHLL